MLVKIVQMEPRDGKDTGPAPYPLDHAFNDKASYFVHDWVQEGSELRAILVNDENEIWAISNRHLRDVSGVTTNA